MASPAFATTEGTFHVSVWDASAEAPLPGVAVKLFSTATGAQVQATLTTDEEGAVDFTGLSDGGYTAQASKTGYYTQFSRVEAVEDAHPSAGQSVALERTAVAKGRVKGRVTKAGSSYFTGSIAAYSPDVAQAQVDNEQASPVAGDDIASDGFWGLTLPVGSYKLQVRDYDSGITRWLGGTTADDAQVVSVTSGATFSAPSATFPSDDGGNLPPRITGTVTGVAGARLGSVSVTLFDASATQRYDQPVAEARTDRNGVFEFSTARVPSVYHCFDDDQMYPSQEAATAAGCTDGHWHYDEARLPAGDYRILLTDPLGEYSGEYYDNVAVPTVDDPGTEMDETQAIPSTAAKVTVPETGTVATNAIGLAPAPAPAVTSGLKGRVVGATGTGIPAYVSIYDANTGNYVFQVTTRRDGSWAVPATDLAPGSYKVAAYDEGDDNLRSAWYGGGTSFRSAPALGLPVKGVRDAGGAALLPWASVSGKVTLPPIAGYEHGSASAFLYDEDGVRVGSTETTGDGTFSFEGLEAGTYFVSASGTRSSLFAEDGSKPFIHQFYAGRYSFATARPIGVRDAAAVRGTNLVLGNKLLATTLPAISGTKAVGKTLKGSTGVWNAKVNTVYSYQWKRGTKVVSTAPTYKVAKADAGQRLTLVVTAKNRYGTYVAGAAASKPVTIPRA